MGGHVQFTVIRFIFLNFTDGGKMMTLDQGYINEGQQR